MDHASSKLFGETRRVDKWHAQSVTARANLKNVPMTTTGCGALFFLKCIYVKIEILKVEFSIIGGYTQLLPFFAA